MIPAARHDPVGTTVPHNLRMVTEEQNDENRTTYMLPSNLNISIRKTKGYKNKFFMSNTDMKIGSNGDIKRNHKKLTPSDVPKKH